MQSGAFTVWLATRSFNEGWCPRRESNTHPPLRTGLFYPLNYRGALVTSVATDATSDSLVARAIV